MEIKIRNVKDSDVKYITKIYEYYVLNDTCTFEEEVPLEEEIMKRKSAITDKNYPYIVATIKKNQQNGSNDDDGDSIDENQVQDDEIVIGFAYASSFRPRVAYRYTVENSIYIDINYQKLGIGSMLLDELIKQCKQGGYKQMIAVIGGFENIGSINLHKKFGFANQSVLKDVGFKFDRFIDTVSLQLPL